MFKPIAAGVGVLVAILALTWIFQGNDFFMYKFFAPKQAAVQREVFEQSKSYRDGMVKELEKMQFEYEQAPKESKEALANIILHRAGGFPQDALTPELKTFLYDLRHPKVAFEAPTTTESK